MRRRSCYGMELCENILKGSIKWFTRDKSRSVTCSSEVRKRSQCPLVWEVRWMKSRAHGIQCGTADSSGSSSVRSSYTKAGRKSWWMQNTRKPGKKHYYMSDSVPVKRVTAVLLHDREDVQRASSGDSEEELSRRCECRSVAQTGQKYEPDVVIRYDVILRSLLKRRSGEHDERDLGCEINTFAERRGCHRVSSEVFFANNGPVENLNKELCGLVRCFQIASKTSPGSRSPEVSSVRQSRVESRA